MTLSLAYAIMLLIAVLISGFARRSIMSTSVLFLAAGFVLGLKSIGMLTIRHTDPFVDILAQLALFSVLFTDGMRVGVRDLADTWRLPSRALLFGMPLTMLLTMVFAHWLVGLSWPLAALLGAVLSPTDPVFAAALVGREEVPLRLRRLLNLESGVNDGLALPVVMALIAIVGYENVDYLRLGGELLGGVALGIALPWLVIKLEGFRFFTTAKDYQAINGLAIGLLLFVLAKALHLNPYLGGFAAGITIASAGPAVRDAFHEFGKILTELLKLAMLLVFGALMSLEYLGQTTAWDIAFVFAALFIVRPLTLNLALMGESLGKRQRLAAAWFGPKGFASVVYGLFILKTGLEESQKLFHLIGLVVTASIVAHSSTDILIAEWFHSEEKAEDKHAALEQASASPAAPKPSSENVDL